MIKNIQKSLTEPYDIHLAIEKLSKQKVELVSIIWKPTDSKLFSNQAKIETYYLTRMAYETLYKNNENKGRPMFKPPLGFIPGYLTCKKSVDAIEYYDDELKKLKFKNSEIVENTLELKKHTGLAFVVFENIKGCEYVKNNWPFQNENTISNEIALDIKKWKVSDAKPYEEIIWKNLGAKKKLRNIKKTISTIFILFLALFWTVPIAFFGNLNNLVFIPIIGPVIQDFFDSFPVIFEYVSGLFPALLQLLLFHFMPSFCLKISKLEKHHHRTALYTSAMEKFWIFVLFNFFIFYMAFSSGVEMFTTLVDNPKQFRDAFENLDWSEYGSFYCNYFISMAFVDGALSFIRPYKIIKKGGRRVLAVRGSSVQKHSIFKPSRFKFYKVLAKEAVYLGIIITFAPIVPLVSVFGFLACIVQFFADKTLITLCYSYNSGTGGKMFFRFIFFLTISLMLSYIFWVLFFLAHAPKEVVYVAIPLYFALWAFTVGVILWVIYLNKIPTKKNSELWSFLEEKEKEEKKFSEEYYSWEFVTSYEAATQTSEEFPFPT